MIKRYHVLKEKFGDEVEKTIGDSTKADKISSRTAKHITEKIAELETKRYPIK